LAIFDFHLLRICGTVFIAFIDFAQLYFTTKCGSKKEYKKQNLTKLN